MINKIAICFLWGLSFTTAVAFAQSSGSAGGSSKSGSAEPAASDRETEGQNIGFAIETEMFTYKAVTENSKVLACDVARYLYGGEVSVAPDGSHVPCTIQVGTQAAPGIVIISSTSSVLADFQLWRADMATMSDLEMRAAKVCVKPSAPSGSVGQSRGLSGILDSTPAGQAFSMFEGALGMLATNQSVTSVTGTVRDQALMNEVARQLRSLNVRVLIPEIYNPYTLSGSDYKNSIYMANLERLFNSRQLCETARADNPGAAQVAQIDGIIGSIESFLKMAMAAPAPPAATQQGAAGGSATASQPSASAASHFAAVFAADGLARQMGFSQDGVTGPSDTWQHILWLKALESGGSVTKEGNIFGTKVRFSGGAVETYAVFAVDGNLVCSGNVYNFESPVRVKDLQNSFDAKAARNPTESPQVQSTCSMLPRTPGPAADTR